MHIPTTFLIQRRIDGEVDRLNHKQEIENARVQRQREWAKMEPSIPKGFDFEEGFTLETTSFDRDRVFGSVPGFSGMSGVSKVQRRKDEKMANDDPARYCADRCVSTGNCDVFEDMFELGKYFLHRSGREYLWIVITYLLFATLIVLSLQIPVRSLNSAKNVYCRRMKNLVIFLVVSM